MSLGEAKTRKMNGFHKSPVITSLLSNCLQLKPYEEVQMLEATLAIPRRPPLPKLEYRCRTEAKPPHGLLQEQAHCSLVPCERPRKAKKPFLTSMLNHKICDSVAITYSSLLLVQDPSMFKTWSATPRLSSF